MKSKGRIKIIIVVCMIGIVITSLYLGSWLYGVKKIILILLILFTMIGTESSIKLERIKNSQKLSSKNNSQQETKTLPVVGEEKSTSSVLGKPTSKIDVPTARLMENKNPVDNSPTKTSTENKK